MPIGKSISQTFVLTWMQQQKKTRLRNKLLKNYRLGNKSWPLLDDYHKSLNKTGFHFKIYFSNWEPKKTIGITWWFHSTPFYSWCNYRLFSETSPCVGQWILRNICSSLSLAHKKNTEEQILKTWNQIFIPFFFVNQRSFPHFIFQFCFNEVFCFNMSFPYYSPTDDRNFFNWNVSRSCFHSLRQKKKKPSFLMEPRKARVQIVSKKLRAWSRSVFGVCQKLHYLRIGVYSIYASHRFWCILDFSKLN